MVRVRKEGFSEVHAVVAPDDKADDLNVIVLPCGRIIVMTLGRHCYDLARDTDATKRVLLQVRIFELPANVDEIVVHRRESNCVMWDADNVGILIAVKFGSIEPTRILFQASKSRVGHDRNLCRIH